MQHFKTWYFSEMGFSWVMGMLLICLVNEVGWNKLKLKNLLRSCPIFQWNWGVHLFLRSCYLWLLLELTVYSFHTWNLSNSKHNEMFLLLEWGIQLCITGDWYVFVFGISLQGQSLDWLFLDFSSIAQTQTNSQVFCLRLDVKRKFKKLKLNVCWSEVFQFCLIWM